MLRKDKVKGPILIPFSLVLLLGLGAVLFVAFQYEEQARKQDLANNARTVERLFKLQIDNDASRLHAALCPISRRQSLKNIFLSGDRELLLTKTRPLFERLRDQHRVTHFYILDASRRVVLRVHQPDMQGDIINRTTTLQAEQTGKETRGIELGPLGTLTLRAVKPWFNAGKLIGYLELGEEIDHVTEEIHSALDVDLMVLLHPQFVPPRESTEHAENSDDAIIFSSTFNNLTPELARKLSNAHHEDTIGQQAMEGDHPLYTALFPLYDAGNREIGDILVVRDVTKLQADFHQSLVVTAVFILLAGGIVFGLFYVILDRVEKDYLHQLKIEMQFARLNTQHKRIVQIEKLSEIGRTISEIAHQINNPLVGVVNMAQMAERVADDPVRVRQLLADIRQAGEDSHAFLKRMLKFTRISRSEIKSTDITALIQETIDLFMQSTEQHPEVTTELVQTPLTLDIDPILIRHALFNLLTNAAQMSPPGAEIKVRLTRQTGDGHRAGLLLSVIDHGTGLSKQVQDKLFTPFFTTQPHGTGLGLPVVQHVAILHDGYVSAENHPDGGAVFAIWLPINQLNDGQA